MVPKVKGMKKKVRLVLPLLTLPLLTSCPPTPDGPRFRTDSFTNQSTISFNLDDGLDLTLSYGLYNRSVGKDNGYYSKTGKYMFLVTNDELDYSSRTQILKRVYDIEGPNSDCCYWKERAGIISYSKEAKIHLDSKYFDPDKDVLTILLGCDEHNSQADFYARYDLVYDYDYDTYYYCINEDQTVTLARYRTYLPNYSVKGEESSLGNLVPLVEESLSSNSSEETTSQSSLA